MARAASAGGRAAAIDDALPQYIYIHRYAGTYIFSSHMCTHPFFRDVRRRERRFFVPGARARTRPFYCIHLTPTCAHPAHKIKMTPDPPHTITH